MAILIPEDFIYGSILDETSDDAVVLTSLCYPGLQLTKCVAKYDQDATGEDLYYYKNLDANYGKIFCLQCCGKGSYRKRDVWNLECPVDAVVGPPTNLYNQEIRFARLSTLDDLSYVSCPINRTSLDTSITYLVGMTVTLEVRMMVENFNAWKSVVGCSVQPYESTTALETNDLFNEEYIMNFAPAANNMEPFSGVLLSLLSIIGVYLILYYFRREHCIICGKKLVFCFDRCYLCRFYGADPPDPLLLQALREKTRALQGQYPERFPGSRKLVRYFRNNYHHYMDKYYYKVSATIYPTNSQDSTAFDQQLDQVGQDVALGGGKDTLQIDNNRNYDGDGEPKYVNPYLVKNDPYFLYKAVRHPHPPVPPPEWVVNRTLPDLEEQELL